MKSTKEGVCKKCLCPVEIGEQIVYQREFGVMHVSCPEDGIVEEHYGYVNMPTGGKDDWCIEVIHPDGAGDREGEEVTILTSRGNLKTETLGKIVQLYQPNHAIYRKAVQAKNDDPVEEPGIYEMPDGTVFRVKFNKAKTNLYAQRLVEINPDRALEEGGRVNIEFEYAGGAIYRLKASYKMEYEKAKALTIRYGRCIVCNRRLKAAQSVEEGIGPVCRQSFRNYTPGKRRQKVEDTDQITLPIPDTLRGDETVEELQAMIDKLKAQQEAEA